MDDKGNIAKPAFNNAQLEMLKLFGSGLDEQTLSEIKDVIADFLLKKSRSEVEKALLEKGMSNKQLGEELGINLD